MRAHFLVIPTVLMALACAGGGSDTPAGGAADGAAAAGAGVAAGPGATPSGTATAAAAGPLANVGSDADKALADHFLVILGSKEDPAEEIPGVEALRRQPDGKFEAPKQLLSSRFKNLMPCYAVTYAAATKDKKEALALSKQLRAIGVDNYVKNAGAWVGASAAIDAHCAAGPEVFVEDVRFATFVAGALWMPVPTADAELAAMVAAAPPYELRSDGYDAWYQPVPGAPTGSGARHRIVDAQSGRTQVCTVAGQGLLTLGTPHFGSVQTEDPPTEPSCGSAARFEELACPDSVATGTWIAVPEEASIGAWTSLGDGGPALVEAAKAALAARTDWEVDPPEAAAEYGEGAVTRELSVTRWKGPSGEVALVSGEREVGPGVCGGDATTWYGVFGLAADGTLGAALGEIHEVAFARVVGLVDIGADGRLEVVTVGFPDTRSVLDVNGSPVTTFSVDFCDCAC